MDEFLAGWRRTGRAGTAMPALRFWRGGLQGSDVNWAYAFLVPYAAVFVFFRALSGRLRAVAGAPAVASYRELFADPIYLRTLVNTLIFLAVGVNLHLFGALLLSGFFMRRTGGCGRCCLCYILPWAVPAIPTFIAIHWMLTANGVCSTTCSAFTAGHQWAVLAERSLAGIGIRHRLPTSGNGCRSGR